MTRYYYNYDAHALRGRTAYIYKNLKALAYFRFITRYEVIISVSYPDEIKF